MQIRRRWPFFFYSTSLLLNIETSLLCGTNTSSGASIIFSLTIVFFKTMTYIGALQIVNFPMTFLGVFLRHDCYVFLFQGVESMEPIGLPRCWRGADSLAGMFWFSSTWTLILANAFIASTCDFVTFTASLNSSVICLQFF